MWGHCSWLINTDLHGGLIGQIMHHSRPIEKGQNFDVSFQVQLPNEWDPNLAKKNIGVSAFVETDRCNPEWINHCNKMSRVIVPSTFTKNVAVRSGKLSTQIDVVPEWYNHSIIKKSACDKIAKSDKRYKFNTRFNIMIMGLLTSMNTNDDRKNLVNTIKWIIETFSGNKDVGIVLKTGLGRDTVQDKLICEANIRKIVDEFRKSSLFPKIHFLHGHMQPNELGALYTSSGIKVFASATRGEGYGLPIIDAAAAGIPIIATGWSGHFEFLDRDLVSCVDYKLNEIAKSRVDNSIFLDGFRWAEPDRDSFCNALTDIYENYKIAKGKANKLKKKIVPGFHKENIKKLYDKILDE